MEKWLKWQFCYVYFITIIRKRTQSRPNRKQAVAVNIKPRKQPYITQCRWSSCLQRLPASHSGDSLVAAETYRHPANKPSPRDQQRKRREGCPFTLGESTLFTSWSLYLPDLGIDPNPSPAQPFCPREEQGEWRAWRPRALGRNLGKQAGRRWHTRKQPRSPRVQPEPIPA